MADQRPPDAPSCPVSAAAAASWPPRRRAVVSGLLVLHVIAAVSAPWAAPPPSSQLARRVAGFFEPYLFAAYLNHGYRFFAPDPGPSHLVRYEVQLPDGSVREGRFPDPHRHRPRLLYHRHFMISETVFNICGPVVEPPERFANPQERRAFQAARQRAELLLAGLAEQLLHEHGGVRVRLFLVEHEMPGPAAVLDGMALDDARLYREWPLGEYTQGGA
jgi:hypothetical protein